MNNTHCSATVAAATATRYGKLTSPESTQQRDILDAQPNKLPMAAFVGLQIGRHKFHFFLWFLLTLPTFYWHRKCFEFRAFLVQIRDQVLLCQCDNSIVTMPQCGDMTPFGLAECQNIVVICHSAFHHRRHQRQKTIVRINRITLHRRFIIVDSSQSLCRLQTTDYRHIVVNGRQLHHAMHSAINSVLFFYSHIIISFILQNKRKLMPIGV